MNSEYKVVAFKIFFSVILTNSCMYKNVISSGVSKCLFRKCIAIHKYFASGCKNTDGENVTLDSNGTVMESNRLWVLCRPEPAWGEQKAQKNWTASARRDHMARSDRAELLGGKHPHSLTLTSWLQRLIYAAILQSFLWRSVDVRSALPTQRGAWTYRFKALALPTWEKACVSWTVPCSWSGIISRWEITGSQNPLCLRRNIRNYFHWLHAKCYVSCFLHTFLTFIQQ